MKVEFNNQPKKVQIRTLCYGDTFTKCGDCAVFIVVDDTKCSQIPNSLDNVFAVNLQTGRIVAFNEYTNVIPVSTKVVGNE